MIDGPLVSVLIANYDSKLFVEAAVESAIGQSYRNIEIIVVDDCSTDGSWEVLKELEAKYPRVTVVQNEANGGEGFTKRRLVNISKGELFGFLDPDDCLVPEAVEGMVDAHAAMADAGTIHSRQENCDANLESLGTFTGVPLGKDETLLERGGSLSHFCTFKRKFYDMTDGIRPGYQLAVDVDLYLKMEEVAAIGFIPEILYHYRCHEGGLSQGENDARAYFWCLLARYEACSDSHFELRFPLLRGVGRGI